MKWTKEEIDRARAELRDQKEPPRPKKRKGKRLFPVKYASDYISTGQAPRVLIGESTVKLRGVVHKTTDAAFDYRGRVGRVARGGTPKGVGLSFDKPTPKEFQNPWFQHTPQDKSQLNSYLRAWYNTVGSKHGVDQFHALRVSATYVLYFYAQEYFWEWEYEEGKVKRSIIYRNKAQAIHAKDYGYVTWV